MPISWHMAWNFGQGWLFGSVVSGVQGAEAPLFTTAYDGSRLLTGGEFGPESSILGPIAELVTLLVFLKLVPARSGAGATGTAGDAPRDYSSN